MPTDIEYSDGDAIEREILGVVSQAQDLSSSAFVGSSSYSSWPVRYHLCPERSNLFRHLEFKGLSVLELGAGMGAVSRFLAEQADSLFVIEGTQARFSVLSERLRDLKNWSGKVANISDVEMESQFDVVCVIGVLEYSQLYVNAPFGETAYSYMLKRVKSFLKPDGVLILAIENKLGIKYFSGAPEDHTGKLFDGICGYPQQKSPRTFSRKELLNLLNQAGFESVVEHFPFPDYKVPTTVLSTELLAQTDFLPADLACQRRYENYGLPRMRYFPDLLAAYSVAGAGLIPEFSNSFLMIASQNVNSAIAKKLLRRSLEKNEIAWHYSLDRKFPVMTTFQSTGNSLIAKKISLIAESPQSVRFPSEEFNVEWKVPPPCEVQDRPSVRWQLVNHAYFGCWTELIETLSSFLVWSFDHWKGSSTESLLGEAFDALYVNAVHDEKSTGFALFDLEWRLETPIPKSWFIFRNVLMLERDLEQFSSDAPFASLEKLYLLLCKQLHVAADFDGDLDRETTFYQMVTSRASYDAHFKLLTSILRLPFPKSNYPRNSVDESSLRNRFVELQAESKKLHSLPHKLTTKLVNFVNRLPLVSGVLNKTGPKIYRVGKKLRHLLDYRPQAAKVWDLRVRPGSIEGKKIFDVVPRGGVFPNGLCVATVEGLEWKIRFQFVPPCHVRETSLTVEGNSSQILRIMVDITSMTLEVVGQKLPPKFKLRRIGKVGTFVMLLRGGLISPGFFLRLVGKTIKSGVRGAREKLSTQVRKLPYISVDPYSAWVQHYDTLTESDRKAIGNRIHTMKWKPMISVVLPVYNTDERWLRRAIDSVTNQVYPNWQLCIADDASTRPEIRNILEKYASKDRRIRLVFRGRNGHISAASNSALALASGEFIALLDHDDELAEHALFRVAEELNRDPLMDLLYSDEDLIDTHDRRFAPHFKPDWCPDLFYSINQITHLAVFRAALVKEVGGFREGFEGSQDWDLMLRMIAKSSPQKIRHIPNILYHWRAIPGSVASGPNEKTYAQQAARRAICEHLAGQGVNAKVIEGFPSLHRVIYPLPAPLPLVSAIICTRDRSELLKEAVNGLLSRTDYDCLELFVVDNGSREESTLTFLKKIANDPRVKIITSDTPFNFSALNNLAARQATGKFLLFLNNDIEIFSSDWLKEMVRLGEQPEIGVVGAKLMYPDDRVQHAGVVLGLGGHGVAGHVHVFVARRDSGYWGRNAVIQNFSAVTAACMLVKRDLFSELGGFDEKNLPVSYNDVDLCLRIREKGYRIAWTPHAELRHLESASRGTDNYGKNRERLEKEASIMRNRWGKILLNDPCYNPNLSLEGTGFALAFPPRLELQS